MKKWSTHIKSIVATLCVLGLMAFANHTNTNKVINVNIEITGNDQQYFLQQKEFESLLFNIYDSINKIEVREINIGMLEDTLETLTYVENAEVYSTLDGILNIRINQNKAIARIHDGSKKYYLNKSGETMPLSSYYSAMVPLVTGNINTETLDYTHQFLMKTINDPFYQDKISGLDFSKSNEIVLFNKLGNHKVYWGDFTNTDEKLNRLKIFYQSLKDQETINKLKTVNLMYNGQVVYTNY